MDWLIFGLAVVCIILIIYYNWSINIVSLRSSVDPSGARYHVISKYHNRQDAADLMAKVKVELIKFLKHIKSKYHIDETDDQIIQEGRIHPGDGTDSVKKDMFKMMDSLLDNYNFEEVYENDPQNLVGDTSYTVNKGRAMYLCVRNKLNPELLVDFNTLMFVKLHELSHIANYNSWGHDHRFWMIFKLILHEAVEFGIYESANYDSDPVMYCGLSIVFQPLNDHSLPNLWENW